jgi:hypothetical protein
MIVWLRVPLVLVMAVVAVAASAHLVAADATAPSTAPTASDAGATADGAPLDPSAVRIAVDLTRTRAELNRVQGRAAEAQARLNSAQAAYDSTSSAIEQNQADMVAVKSRLRVQAVTAYQRSGTINGSLLTVASSNLGAAVQYSEAALQVDDADLSRLDALEQTLEGQRDRQAADVDALNASVKQLAADHDRLTELQHQEQALLDHWGAVPVMGDAWLTADQLARWYQSSGAMPNLQPGTTIQDIARLYIIEGTAEHVRGDLAFAQAIVETGGFKVAAGNNFAGIGVCDSCTGGYTFPTPLDGIRAQIQLLRNYADPDSKAASLANPPSPTLYGPDPAKAAALFDSFQLKGKAPLWNVMGSGNWATDPDYGRKVVEQFAKMVAFSTPGGGS